MAPLVRAASRDKMNRTLASAGDWLSRRNARGIDMTETERNQQVADRICLSLKWDGKSFDEGDCVALLEGQVVAVADDLDGVLQTLRSLEPNVKRGMVVEVTPPVVDVIR
jgi:hypothetical protein